MGFLGGQAEAQSASPSPKPSPAPTPSPTPGRLRLDIEKHVERRLAEEEAKGVPRFETQVEVTGKSPQMMLDRYFGGVDLECPPGGAPAGGGAPSHIEMREARPPVPPYADFLALGKFIAEKLGGKGNKPERYFLYRVHGKDGASYLLREGRAPESLLHGAPGTTFELVETFSDLDRGTRALRRLERGLPATPGPWESPPPVWQSTTCRPYR